MSAETDRRTAAITAATAVGEGAVEALRKLTTDSWAQPLMGGLECTRCGHRRGGHRSYYAGTATSGTYCQNGEPGRPCDCPAFEYVADVAAARERARGGDDQ